MQHPGRNDTLGGQGGLLGAGDGRDSGVEGAAHPATLSLSPGGTRALQLSEGGAGALECGVAGVEFFSSAEGAGCGDSSDADEEPLAGSAGVVGSGGSVGSRFAERDIQHHSTTRHYYVDVPNPEESNYEANEQHVSIDPGFMEQLERGNESNISQFLRLPELIPAKKRKRQQPLLDYTQSKILTSKDYIIGLEEVLAKRKPQQLQHRKKGGEGGKQRATQATKGTTTKTKGRACSTKSTKET